MLVRIDHPRKELVMKALLFLTFFMLASAVSISQASASQYIILFDCADVEVKTNGGEPGQMGPAVMTTYIRTESSRFKLVARDSETSPLIRGMSHGSKVSFMGITNLEADAQGDFALEPQGSVTVCSEVK
jgi:hypothetical protein